MIHDTALDEPFASSSPAATRAKALCAAGRMAYFESDFAARALTSKKGWRSSGKAAISSASSAR